MEKIRVFTDGACSGNGTAEALTGIGVVVEWVGKPPTVISKHYGKGTNNTAEYNALLEGLQYIYDEKIMAVEIKSDSNLMVNQVNGNWKVKDATLKELCWLAQKRINYLIQEGYDVTLEYIPRKFNLADEPAKQGVNAFE